MANVYSMLARVDFLDEIRENERAKAAVQLQAEMDAFVAHYGYVSTDRCMTTWRTYVLLRDGLILRKEEEEDEGETVEIINLSLAEMEFIREFMEDVINNDLSSMEDEIGRYQDLY